MMATLLDFKNFGMALGCNVRLQCGYERMKSVTSTSPNCLQMRQFSFSARRKKNYVMAHGLANIQWHSGGGTMNDYRRGSFHGVTV